MINNNCGSHAAQTECISFRSLIDRIQVGPIQFERCQQCVKSKLTRNYRQRSSGWIWLIFLFVDSFRINNCRRSWLNFSRFLPVASSIIAFWATMHQFHSQSHFYHCQRIQMKIQCRFAFSLSRQKTQRIFILANVFDPCATRAGIHFVHGFFVLPINCINTKLASNFKPN